MKSLLEYTVVPLKYEYKMQHAQLKPQDTAQMPKHTMQKTGGNLQIRQSQAQIRQDSTQFRSTLGYKGTAEVNGEWAQRSVQAAAEATEAYAAIGNQIRHIENKGTTLADAYYNQAMQRLSGGNLAVTPLAAIETSFTGGGAEINYQQAKLQFDWSISQVRREFVPASFKLNISQYNSIKFEYVGKPIYVPASADPEYEATV
ncbi:MAG: DUF6470 family protein [Oscillospiraceae bacterium]|nr:DUF6470 family protein [Oscillospiraceae bacterium]